MEHVFWAIPGKLAGRPGPNRAPWDPIALRRGGFRAVLSVNGGIDVEPDALRAAGLAHLRVPFPSGIPPHPNALEVALGALPAAYAFYQEHSRDGAVLVHCSFGKDRTCLCIGHILMQEQALDVNNTLARLHSMRSIALSADGWEALTRDVLSRFERRNRDAGELSNS
jgi:protein-tyrosine phosphatase